MKTLNIDIETYSDQDLPKVGVYRYCDSPAFEILLFAYSIDGGSVQMIDLAQGGVVPNEILIALQDPAVMKVAFNAQFERVAIGRAMKTTLDPKQWHCTKVWAAELGLPASLGRVAKYLDVDEQKDKSGVSLITYFSKPCKPTKVNGMRKRNRPEDAPEKWQTFADYCKQDVRTEMAIADKLAAFPMKESEWALYSLDQEINDRGALIDVDLADGAIAIVGHLNEINMAKLKAVTGLENPNSLKQLKEWLTAQGCEFTTLGKATVQEALAKGDLPEKVQQALELRLKLSNSSTKKYLMMENARCSDGRIHGLLQFYGANRTGRWAGRLLQVQNLPRNYLDNIDLARDFVKKQDNEAIDMIWGDVPDILKQLIRTGIIAKPAHTFLISDFSAIEARVIAWYAGEEWALEAFRTHGKIYEATASQMFNVALEDVDKPLRQKGKVATLALGYQGGPGALTAMGALSMGIPEDELPELVKAWRNANKNVVKFWRSVEKAVKDAIWNGGVYKASRGLKAFMKQGFLFIQLPSGRRLAYAKARLEEGTYGQKIVYEGQGDKVAFTKLDTYGGKLVENIVQATARDLLGEALLRLDAAGFNVVAHVHDEVIAEQPKDGASVDAMSAVLCQVPEWAEGLPLNSAGFQTDWYMKE